MAGYTPLFSSIVTSSIWAQDNATRIVWITMLALADRNGVVEGSVLGLAHMARVTLEECQRALQALTDPDPYSRTTEHEGRRIHPIDGGWQIYNFAKFRRRAKHGADYYQQWREKKKSPDPLEEKQTTPDYPDYTKQGQPRATKRNQAQPSASSSPQESKSHKRTSADRILSAWQELPLPPEKKQIDGAGILAVERAISILAGDSQEPVHEGMILEAIENYKHALSLPDSQTFKHKLHNWLMEHVRKYVSYNFDLDHHRKSNFDKTGKTDTKTEYERMKAKGAL